MEILEFCSAENCIRREQYYLNLLGPEYNILKVAGSLLGFKHSKKTIDKLKSSKLTEDQKIRQLQGLKRVNANPYFSAKRLERIKKFNSSLEQQERLKIHNANLKFKADRLEQLKRLHQNPEFKAKNLERLRRINADPEHKARRLEHLNRINADPEVQAKRLKSLESHLNSAEHLKRLKDLNFLRSNSVSVLDSKTNETRVYPSISEAAKVIGVTQSAISRGFKRVESKSSSLNTTSSI